MATLEEILTALKAQFELVKAGSNNQRKKIEIRKLFTRFGKEESIKDAQDDAIEQLQALVSNPQSIDVEDMRSVAVIFRGMSPEDASEDPGTRRREHFDATASVLEAVANVDAQTITEEEAREAFLRLQAWIHGRRENKMGLDPLPNSPTNAQSSAVDTAIKALNAKELNANQLRMAIKSITEYLSK